LARSAAWSYPPGMNADAADSERWKPELLSFAQVRAELLAVVLVNHPEFTLEEAERMLREAGF
jgi:hypothetical protein